MSEAEALAEDQAAQILEELVASGDAPAQPELFALGTRRERPSERLHALERVGEKVSRALRGAIEPLAAARTRVIAQPITTGAYEDFTDTLAPFTSYSHYRLDPLNGGMLVTIEPQFVVALLERYYGGGIGQAEPFTRKEFTAGEEMLLGRLLDRVVTTLAEQWQPLAPIEPRLVQRETALADIGFLRGEDQVVIQRFTLSPDGCASTTVSIVYPLALIKPIEERMQHQAEDTSPTAAQAWRAKLSSALSEVRLPVRSVLARPEITLNQLMALKVGDVIPIQLTDRTPLLVASRQVAAGTIGEQEGRAAMLIEKIGRN
ncbi:flagellar motor switch protein FliM [Sphingomonas vulcanisoli]|uniref:Flagellar motor switch protein FliM n=1 Tax=Sphingomonas vulcanisoli TaxID=1658060 RepID=A0ABX0TVQ6_9SPHN|nr:FliM/FliN family flagellar motor switch protein [Sphingomonas vulcanisoli]NIJ09583.1 flagellar motor switch protein FliM [Sphingomonas vulcanisoli]